MTTITLKDFQAFAQQRIEHGLSHPEQLSAKLQEVFEFAIANEKAMDKEANAYFDKVLSDIADRKEQELSKETDSPHKRQLLRQIALTRKKHHRADKLAQNLGRPLFRKFPVAEAAKPIFLATLQSVLDVLFDATRESQAGVAQFGSLSMLYWAVDELNVAFYLAEHKYATQTYSHLRTAYDLLEKVELLFKQPKWAEVWGGSDRKRILNELKPGAVRAKLGRPKFDVVYSFLSEMGSHGTFEAVRRRVVRKKRGNQSDRPEIGIWVGGVPFDSEVVISVSLCIFAVMSTLIMAVVVFETRLYEKEVKEILRVRSKDTTEFLERYFVQFVKELGIDASDLLKTIKSMAV
jgi:hypothetical protein